MLPNKWSGDFFLMFFRFWLSFIRFLQLRIACFPFVLPRIRLYVLGSREAPGRVLSSSTGCSGTESSLAFKGCLVETSRNQCAAAHGGKWQLFPL